MTQDDSVIGPVERSKAHEDQLLHRFGMIFLHRSDGKIMLQYRSPGKTPFPNCWDSSSSFHVIFGESYEQAARRELREETGISARPVYLAKFSYHVPPENELVAVFKCKSSRTVKIDPSESSGASFHTADEVDRIISSEVLAPWLLRGWELASGTMHALQEMRSLGNSPRVSLHESTRLRKVLSPQKGESRHAGDRRTGR